MLFVSKFAAYRHIVSAGSMRWVKDVNGSERQVDNGDFFWAEFKLGGLDKDQQDIAVQAFRDVNPNAPFGAEPLMIDGTINQMDAASEGETSNSHEGYQVWQRLSRFDTEDKNQCPPRWQEDAERCLLESNDFGRDFLRLDLLTLIAPWATYDEMPEEEIVAFALQGGFDLNAVARYEGGTKRREKVGKQITAALKRQEADKAERDALTVIG